MPLRSLICDPLLLELVPFLGRFADEPARRFDVRQRDDTQRDRKRRGRVSMRERGQRQERLGVEHGRRLGETRDKHGGAHEQRELCEGWDEHRNPGAAAMASEELVAPRNHIFLDPLAVHFMELPFRPASLFYAHFMQDLFLYDCFCLLESGHDQLFRSPLSLLCPNGEWDGERKTRRNGK